MTYPSDDLTPLFGGKPPPALRYGQAILTAWDPATWHNQIQWRGVTMTDLPVKSAVEALTLQAGDSVALEGWDPSGTGGASQYWIAGRIVRPGAENAERVISFLQTELAKAIIDEIVELGAVQVISDRITFDNVATAQLTTSTSYTNLATVGPTVTNVDIQTGRALVFLSSSITSQQSGNGEDGGFMSFQMSGTGSLSPDDSRALFSTVRQSHHAPDPHVTDIRFRATSMIPLIGLTPGAYTFQAKYRNEAGLDGSTGSSFSNRTLAVIAF